jgi:hypothetical protein
VRLTLVECPTQCPDKRSAFQGPLCTCTSTSQHRAARPLPHLTRLTFVPVGAPTRHNFLPCQLPGRVYTLLPTRGQVCPCHRVSRARAPMRPRAHGTPPASSTHQARTTNPQQPRGEFSFHCDRDQPVLPGQLRERSTSRRSTSAWYLARRTTPQGILPVCASICPILLYTTQQYTGGKATPRTPLPHLPSRSAYSLPEPLIHATLLVIAKQDPRTGASIPTSNLHADHCKTQNPRIDSELIRETFYAAVSDVLQ